MGNLTKHAEYELKLAGLFDEDSDYKGMLGDAALELVKVFAKQGHSGASAAIVRNLFNELANFMPLSPIGKSDDEWMNVSGNIGEPMWQNKRRGTTFSRDAGKTWYDIDNPKLNNGDTWKKEK